VKSEERKAAREACDGETWEAGAYGLILDENGDIRAEAKGGVGRARDLALVHNALPAALDALDAADAELARMRDRLSVMDMGIFACSVGDGWVPRLCSDDPDDEVYEVMESEEGVNLQCYPYPTKDTALDAAVECLKAKGLLPGEVG
jgi:hypothetical protein